MARQPLPPRRTGTPFQAPSVAWNVAEVGLRVGANVERGVGDLVGVCVGLAVGPSVGSEVGLSVGEVGLEVGLTVQTAPAYMVSLCLPIAVGFVLFHAGRTSKHIAVFENTGTEAPRAVSTIATQSELRAKRLVLKRGRERGRGAH